MIHIVAPIQREQGSKQIMRSDEKIAEKEAERTALQAEWEQRSRRLEDARQAGNAAKAVSQLTLIYRLY